MNKAMVINSAAATRDWFFGDSKSRHAIRWTFYVIGKVLFSLALGSLMVDALFYYVAATDGWGAFFPAAAIEPQDFVAGVKHILQMKLIAAFAVSLFPIVAGGWTGPRR